MMMGGDIRSRAQPGRAHDGSSRHRCRTLTPWRLDILGELAPRGDALWLRELKGIAQLDSLPATEPTGATIALADSGIYLMAEGPRVCVPSGCSPPERW